IKMGRGSLAIAVSAACLLIGYSIAIGPYDWMHRDNFDLIMEKMISVDEKNCKEMSIDSLRLPVNTLGQVPKFNVLPQIVVFPNRTKLIHLHNMALNRGYFFSYILQRLNESEFDFPLLPGFMYYYLSSAATVTSAPGLLNGSSILFDTHCQYANWFPTILNFNQTLPLFGPKAWRLDDYQDNVNWLREPTNNTIIVEDLGAGPNHNYTARWHRLNPLFLYDPDPRIKIDFIPDLRTDNQAKHQYDYNIYNSSSPGVMGKTPNVTRRFFGPPSPGIQENYHPVYFSRPYFDCGRTNMWLVSSVGPVIDFMRRYSIETNLRSPKYVAVSTSDIDFRRIDFDPCKRGVESPDHTYLSGVARCGSTTTCEPLPGYGFQRGGYMCHCLPGFRYPYWQNGPFLGRNIEQASDEEAKRFECIPVRWRIHRLTQSGISNSGTGNRRRKRSADDVKLLVQLMRLYNASSMTELRVRAEEHDRQDQQAAAQAKLQRTGVRRFVQLAKSAVSAAVSYLRNATGGSSAAQNSTASPSIVSTKLLPRHPLPEATQRLLDERKSRVKRNIETIADYGEQNIYYLGRLSSFSSDRYNAVKALMRQYVSITPENCGAQPPDRLVLPGEVGFGADKQFEVQARTALRLAHFLSAFQQNVNPDEIYGGVHGDKYLNEHQIYGEVFSNIMADHWILSSGVYYDRDAFFNPKLRNKVEYFGPTAYKLGSEQRTDQKQRELSFVAEDAAGWEAARAYYERDWFKLLKERWASNTYGLEKFVTKPFVRFDLNGTSSKPFQRFPIYYRAPRYEDIYWSKPYFDCNKDKDPNKRHLNAWVITVAVPFFGISPYKSLEFSGVVTVSVPLSKMDINMCPSNFYEANYFKNTAPCHYETTYCVPIINNRFALDSYKCECRQGYEYPFNDVSIWFHAGGMVSQNYEKMVNNEQNYYRMLTCREGSASSLLPTLAAVALALVSPWLTGQLTF
ncbi:hypothetical protein BOX15_Mlig022400g1, partial [Macrostomum lignano]